MILAWCAVVCALGFFALASQTLLFRAFLTVFEGSELGIGCFFLAWLLWVAVGALAGRVVARRTGVRTRHFGLLALLYLPAFAAQHALIVHAREIAGVVAYEHFPLHRMAAVALLANAPVSLCTGLLFTLACRCTVLEHRLPVAVVYLLESLGGFLGGVAVTLLLAGGHVFETIALDAALLLALAVALFAALERTLPRGARVLGILPALALVLALAAGVDTAWAQRNRRAAWTRLLPAEAYRGHFATAQGEYLHGQREGQFVVVAWGGVSEALPDTEHASEVVALTLAQHPGARRILVLGPGSLAIAQRFAALPGVGRVTWMHTDPDYPPALAAVLPARLRADIDMPPGDVRAFLAGVAEPYDLAVLHLPDATTLVLNRYLTRDFFAMLASAVRPDGVVALRVSGGANYLGGELALLGASARRTLGSVFDHLALKPGDESWILASRARSLGEAPAALRDRFAAIPGAAALYPPEGLLALYAPDRIAFQRERYAQATADAGDGVLLNRDAHPLALLHALAVALRRMSGWAVAGALPVLLATGAALVAAAVLVYGLLRVLFLATGPPGPGPRLFDASFLVFSTGLAGMALSVVLLFAFQVRHGTLYLHAGLAFANFMLGACVGALALERMLARGEPRRLLPVLLVLHAGFLAVVWARPGDVALTLFLLAGLFTGAYFPVAARRLRDAGQDDDRAGARLEGIDHVGGAAGAATAGLVLLPLLGAPATVALLLLLVASNLPPALLTRGAAPADRGRARLRAAAYWTLGAAAYALAASNLVAAGAAGREGRLLEEAARDLTGGAALHLHDTPAAYVEVADEPGGYVFPTAPFVEGVFGYGGPVRLAVHVDAEGVLRGFRVLRSNETPAYLERLAAWRSGLAGRALFAARPFADVDTVTGATMSSAAILRTLEEAGRRFAGRVLGREVAGAGAPPDRGPDRSFVALGLLTLGAILLRYRPRPWLRRVFLLATVVVAGLWLNLQFSTQQVFSLLGLQLPGLVLTGSFFLLVVVPVVVVLFGNVYCGWVCPFGAAQELLGDLRPRTFASDPSPGVWRHGRAVKYALLALLAILYGVTRDATVLSADPLITVFGEATGFVLGLALVALVLALPYRRFWCRNLCPAGAFLALLHRFRLLRRIVPATRPGRCDLGVQSRHELDCLACDRCRHADE